MAARPSLFDLGPRARVAFAVVWLARASRAHRHRRAAPRARLRLPHVLRVDHRRAAPVPPHLRRRARLPKTPAAGGRAPAAARACTTRCATSSTRPSSRSTTRACRPPTARPPSCRACSTRSTTTIDRLGDDDVTTAAFVVDVRPASRRRPAARRCASRAARGPSMLASPLALGRRWRDEVGDVQRLGLVRLAARLLPLPRGAPRRRARGDVGLLRHALPHPHRPRVVVPSHARLRRHRSGAARARHPRRRRHRRAPGAVPLGHRRPLPALRRSHALPPPHLHALLDGAARRLHAVRSLVGARPPLRRRRRAHGPAMGHAPPAAAAHDHLPDLGRLEAARRRAGARGAVLADRVVRYGNHAIALGVPHAIIDFLRSPLGGHLMAKGAIATELGLAVCLWLPRTRRLAAWGGIAFHVVIDLTRASTSSAGCRSRSCTCSLRTRRRSDRPALRQPRRERHDAALPAEELGDDAQVCSESAHCRSKLHDMS